MMKKIAVFFIFVSIGASFSALYADDAANGYADSYAGGVADINRLKATLRSYTLSLSSQFGMLWGQGEEQVYENADSDRLLSQLLWDIKPLWYLGLGMEFAQKDPMEGPGIVGVLSAKFGIPAMSGTMEDRDWQALGGKLSNYSWHDNLTEGAVMLDLTLGLSIPAWNLMTIRFFAGISYTRFSWGAYDGYYRYGKKVGSVYDALTDSDSAFAMSGPVVSYSQDWLYLPFGIRISTLPKVVSLALYYSAGPVLNYLGQDRHYMRVGTGYYGQFIDEMNGGYVLEGGGEFRFSPLERFSLLLRVSHRSMSASPHGRSFGSYTGTGSRAWDFLGATAGGRFQSLDLGIGLEVRL
ncbi:MAG: omptin family outer membrane protease [Treponema sp.]|jgi:outer membrane protease|nr:omptin family outer membrane protease [Treponema sp.]